jgi:hypothetical protein
VNVFLFDLDHSINAQYYCDLHNNKMILESMQILCSALHLNGLSFSWMYKPTHLKHGCVLWAAESWDNWHYLYDLMMALHDEKVLRTGKSHKSAELLRAVPVNDLKQILNTIPRRGPTPPYLAMPEKYRSDDIVSSYRRYFASEKQHIAKWTGRPVPQWYTELTGQLAQKDPINESA